jgi:hypothetical protein
MKINFFFFQDKNIKNEVNTITKIVNIFWNIGVYTILGLIMYSIMGLEKSILSFFN